MKESGRALVTHHASDEPKARALVLSAEGHSSEAVGGMVGVSGRTVLRWVARCREVSRNQEAPEILDDWARIVRRAQGMMHAFLDVVDDLAATLHDEGADADARAVAAKELVKHAMTLNVYAGTGTDKLQKESEPNLPPGDITINFISQAPPDAPDREHPDVVEGELVGEAPSS